MKMNVFIIVLVLAGLLCLTACGSKEPTIELTSAYDGATVDLCDPEVRAYLNAETEEELIKTLLEKEEKITRIKRCHLAGQVMKVANTHYI